ncbi:MAG: hypothetical protein O3B01_29765 [Planctomycetota bacterium]|nr:hypothetical protein [Planctomycetota bacterium]MDA1142770.1 hypothetical protein [Planctomycetota bacterium]
MALNFRSLSGGYNNANQRAGKHLIKRLQPATWLASGYKIVENLH